MQIMQHLYKRRVSKYKNRRDRGISARLPAVRKGLPDTTRSSLISVSVHTTLKQQSVYAGSWDDSEEGRLHGEGAPVSEGG